MNAEELYAAWLALELKHEELDAATIDFDEAVEVSGFTRDAVIIAFRIKRASDPASFSGLSETAKQYLRELNGELN